MFVSVGVSEGSVSVSYRAVCICAHYYALEPAIGWVAVGDRALICYMLHQSAP